MTLIDEFTRECLAIRVARRINGFGVLEAMADVMLILPSWGSECLEEIALSMDRFAESGSFRRH
jgi:hypothetical protein